MKTFAFPLEKVLRWREAQLDIEKSRAAGALARISEIQTAMERQRSESVKAANDIAKEPDGGSISSYAGFVERNRAHARKFQQDMGDAKKVLAAEMKRVVEANRKLHLLEKLKAAERVRWRKELERDLGQFADEAFLGRIESRRRHREL